MQITTGSHGPQDIHSGQTLLQRLRVAGLRPTVARIGVMQLLEAVMPQRQDADAVLRGLLERGIQLSPGTVYRTLKDLGTRGLLVQEWRNGCNGGRVVYALRPRPGQAGQDCRILCDQCGCATFIHDSVLLEQLRQLALSQGLELAQQPMTILAACSQCKRVFS